MLEKTLDLVTDQDRQDILDGVLVMRNADVEPGGVALSCQHDDPGSYRAHADERGRRQERRPMPPPP